MKHFEAGIVFSLLLFIVLACFFLFNASSSQTGELVSANMKAVLLPSKELKCVDFDGGINVFSKGRVLVEFSKNSIDYFDYCLNENVLKEYFCVGKKQSFVYRNCKSYGKTCFEGKCK